MHHFLFIFFSFKFEVAMVWLFLLSPKLTLKLRFLQCHGAGRWGLTGGDGLLGPCSWEWINAAVESASSLLLMGEQGSYLHRRQCRRHRLATRGGTGQLLGLEPPSLCFRSLYITCTVVFCYNITKRTKTDTILFCHILQFTMYSSLVLFLFYETSPLPCPSGYISDSDN